MGWQDAPVVGAQSSGWQSAPKVGGKTAPAAAGSGLGSFLTSPEFMNESYLNEAKDIGLSAADYLALNQLKRIVPDSVGNAIAQAHSNLGYADYGIGAGTYALGPGKFLKPLAASAGLGGLGTTALEGAMAGGISGFDPSNPVGSTAAGATVGAGLGAAANKASSAIGTAVSHFGPQVDPAVAVASTKALRDQAYAPLKQITFEPRDVIAAHSSSTLTPGMAADVSPSMNSMLGRQQQAILGGGNTANDIADYVTNLRSAGNSPGASNGDRILAGQTADSLEGLLANGAPTSGHAPGEAMSKLLAAREAHQNYAAAQALQQYASDLKTYGASPGADPMKQAQFYSPGDPRIQTWADLYKAGAQSSGGLSYPLTHMAAEGAEALGAAAGLGGPAVAGIGAAAHLAKLPIKGLANAYKRAKLGQEIQKAYPSVTGVSPAGPPLPDVGDAIKALMLSQGSQYGV